MRKIFFHRLFFPSIRRFLTTDTTPIHVIHFISFCIPPEFPIMVTRGDEVATTHLFRNRKTEYVFPKEVRMRQENDKTSTQDLPCSTQNHRRILFTLGEERVCLSQFFETST